MNDFLKFIGTGLLIVVLSVWLTLSFLYAFENDDTVESLLIGLSSLVLNIACWLFFIQRAVR